MGKISILPDTLCNQIAAGEVIERPAAVVKELLENSVDADGTKIIVALQQGGRREIRVTDNGQGMERDDALLAIERHATSKIRNMDDLQSIMSLGFRGEALPSIASVSRFEIVTRTEGEVSGTLVRVEGGVLRDVRDKGAPVGTTITVRDLFYNLPARRKFLRTVDTEMGHINDQFQKLALAHPGIHFQLAHQDREISRYPAATDGAQRAGQVLGVELVRKLRPFSFENKILRIHGYLSPPDLQRTSSQAVFSFLNGRPIWDRLVNRSILSAYESLLPKGKFPVVLLYMDLDPALVDVNVHPTKREVRFRSPGDIMEAVRLALREALKGNAPVMSFPDVPVGGLIKNDFFPRTEREQGRGFLDSASASRKPPPPTRDSHIPQQLPVPAFSPSSSFPAPKVLHEQPRELSSAGRHDAMPEGSVRFGDLHILGQAAHAYIVLESPTGLVIVDQHAAHERIIYDRLCAAQSHEPSQRLLRPVVVDLPPRQAVLLRKWLEELKSFGFDIEPFGGDAFVVHALPAGVPQCSPEALIRDLLESAHEDESRPRWDLRARVAGAAACRQAVKAGQRMSPEEIRHLLRDLDRTAFPHTCPHGRPLSFEIDRDELKRRFQRS